MYYMFGKRTYGLIMATSKPKLTAEQFEALVPKLVGRMTSALDSELKDCALPELGGKAGSGKSGSDLWDGLPTVDSKTVCKLSPIVNELLGRRLEPAWVRKGGYQSVEAAIKDVIANMRKDCVVGSPQPAPVKSPQPLVTA